MALPGTQTAVIQSQTLLQKSGLPVTIAHDRPVLKDLPSPHHVQVRILAVGLNPTDHKMVTHFPMDGNTVGCDFCGTVISSGTSALFHPGDRVCGAEFPYRPDNPRNGAFSQYMVCDSRHMLKVPKSWSDTQGAALGAIGWGTACLAISDPEALNLKGTPSQPSEKPLPVLVYGGATATGIMAIQMLKLSGYSPIGVCSQQSSARVIAYGAVGTASYTSTKCVEEVKALANGVPIKHALDCITDAASTMICYNVLARVGARYTCLEDCPEAWRTRRAVKVKVVMGFEGEGYDVDVGHPVYSRKANPELHAIASLWSKEMQSLLDEGSITTQPVLEIQGRFEGVLRALQMLQNGEVKGEKLAVRIVP